jgi:hypothetical protein
MTMENLELTPTDLSTQLRAVKAGVLPVYDWHRQARTPLVKFEMAAQGNFTLASVTTFNDVTGAPIDSRSDYND